MLDFGFYNADCMEHLKEFPDKYFDLAIVDPPYGINIGSASMGAGGGVSPQTNRSAKNIKSSTSAKEIGGGIEPSEARSRSAIQVGGGTLRATQNL